nr:hypothetical protein Iba_chr11aCG8780 [Ipomoea batatas]
MWCSSDNNGAFSSAAHKNGHNFQIHFVDCSIKSSSKPEGAFVKVMSSITMNLNFGSFHSIMERSESSNPTFWASELDASDEKPGQQEENDDLEYSSRVDNQKQGV